MSKEIYEKLYSGKGKGDTWTMPGDVYLNPRLAEVVRARNLLGKRPAHVMDIGCGAGINSMWIAVNDDQSSWLGVDYVISLELGIPKGDRFSFIQGDILDPSLIEDNPDLTEKKNMVVDQGSVLAGLEGEELDSYLRYIHNILDEKGLFVTAVMKGDEQHRVVFPDGRVRIAMNIDTFKAEPFTKYFKFIEGGKSYSYNNDEKNPLVTEEQKQKLEILQVILEKI